MVVPQQINNLEMMMMDVEAMEPAEVLAVAVREIRARAGAATPGPWWHDESEQCWRLHGVARRIPTTLGGHTFDQVVNKQILKAPKKSLEYTEYWPGEADTAHMVPAANPLVWLAIADWLDTGTSRYSCVDREPMLAVARAYLAGIEAAVTG